MVATAKEYNAIVTKASNALARGRSSLETTPPTRAEEAQDLFTGRLLYDNNLRLLTETMSKKGLHTVNMGLCGEITSITRVAARTRGGSSQVTLGVHGGMGGAASFRLICHGNGTVPTFGNLDGLNDNQKNIVRIMRQDFQKMCNVVDTGVQEKKKQEMVQEAMKCGGPTTTGGGGSKKNKRKKKNKKSTRAAAEDKTTALKTADELFKEKLEDHTQELINRFGALPVTYSQLREQEKFTDAPITWACDDDDDAIGNSSGPKLGRGKVKRSEITNISQSNTNQAARLLDLSAKIEKKDNEIHRLQIELAVAEAKRKMELADGVGKAGGGEEEITPVTRRRPRPRPN